MMIRCAYAPSVCRQRLALLPRGLFVAATLACLALGALPGSVGAQSVLCWREADLKACRSVVITELGLRTLTLSTRRTVAFNGSDGEERARIRALGDELTWETGLLLVARDRVAIGPTIEYGVNTRRTGIRARHARTDGVTVETRLGAMRAHPGREAVPSGSEARAGHGATVSTRVMFGGDFSVGLSYDDLAWPDQPLSSGRRYVGSPRARALALDVALGGDTGTLFAVGLVGAAALVVLTFALPCPCPGQPPETVSAARAAR